MCYIVFFYILIHKWAQSPFYPYLNITKHNHEGIKPTHKYLCWLHKNI